MAKYLLQKVSFSALAAVNLFEVGQRHQQPDGMRQVYE
jgi:hypothetical protein